jgi:hypothetical protein
VISSRVSNKQLITISIECGVMKRGIARLLTILLCFAILLCLSCAGALIALYYTDKAHYQQELAHHHLLVSGNARNQITSIRLNGNRKYSFLLTDGTSLDFFCNLFETTVCDGYTPRAPVGSVCVLIVTFQDNTTIEYYCVVHYSVSKQVAGINLGHSERMYDDLIYYWLPMTGEKTPAVSEMLRRIEEYKEISSIHSGN